MALKSATQYAILSFLWRFGDKAFAANRFADAARWYTLGTRPPLPTGKSATKWLRKAAMCHLRLHDFDEADRVLQGCAVADEAASHYVRFLVAALRGDEREGAHSFAS
jgi:hypothetical protein